MNLFCTLVAQFKATFLNVIEVEDWNRWAVKTPHGTKIFHCFWTSSSFLFQFNWYQTGSSDDGIRTKPPQLFQGCYTRESAESSWHFQLKTLENEIEMQCREPETIRKLLDMVFGSREREEDRIFRLTGSRDLFRSSWLEDKKLIDNFW